MNYDFNAFKKQLAGTEEWLKKELQQIRTGQASPAVLDSVKVESYGTPMSMKEVASVTIEGARTLRITPWDMSQAKAIEKAITIANLGVSVAVDDQGLRVSFPDLTAETRTQIAKNAKDKLEEAKKQIRLHKDMQKLVDEMNKKLEDVFAKKEKEIIN
jgi:ribosome recycling factor